MRNAVVLFAKAPEPGHVKTRLAAHLGTAAAALLHQAFVYDMVESLATLDADLFIATDREGAWPELRIPVVLQCGANLGERIRHALSASLTARHPACAIVGSDSPTLPPSYVSQLLSSAADVAIGPACDGGFYAIACRRTAEAMFDGVNWSTASTLRDTRAALVRANLSVELGKPWFDIDTPGDLEHLQRAELPRHTRRWMEMNLAPK